MSRSKFLPTRGKIRSTGLVRPRTTTGRNQIRDLSSTTYYDSQSGLHIPVQNEKEIKIFLNVSQGRRDGERSSASPWSVPHQLHRNRDEFEEVREEMEALVRRGINGLILPPLQFPRDVRNLRTLTAIDPGFSFLYSCAGQSLRRQLVDAAASMERTNDAISSLSLILEYGHNADDDDEKEERTRLQASLNQAQQDGLHTTLSIAETVYASGDVEPITLANTVGTLIDTVKGCDLIWISSSSKSKDAVVSVCEELIYLDVAGPTIKTRLLVDVVDEDILEDIMFAGVNKYVIDDESQVEMVEKVAMEQGKSIVR